MIEVNLLVPIKDKNEIDEKFSGVIMEASNIRRTDKRFFLIKMSEEDFTFLMIKYGSENVWRR